MIETDGLPTLPANWAWDRATNVCLKIQDGTHFSPKNQQPDGQYKYVTAKNIRPWGMDLADVTYLDEQDHRAIYKRCDPKKGDVLLVKDGVNTGDAALNMLDEEFSLLSSVCMLRPDTRVIEGAFLRYFLQSPIGYTSLTGQMSGTAIKRIVLHRIRDLAIPIAPLPEQGRIVAEIETQFTRLDAAVAALERARANLKRYRAAVVVAGCSGMFGTLDQLTKLDLRPKAIERWQMTTLGELTSLVTSGSRGWSQYYSDQGALFIRAQDINKDRLDLKNVARIQLPGNVEGVRSRVRRDDLLVTITGANVTKTAMVGIDIGEAYVSQHVAVVRPTCPDISRFLYYWIISPSHGRKVLEKLAYGAGKPGLNLANLRELHILLPPVEEQCQIVAEIERRLSVAEGIEAVLSASLIRTERMRQSILHKAFAGQLVSQDPADEPASVLLERIRAERAGSNGVSTLKSRHGSFRQQTIYSTKACNLDD